MSAVETVLTLTWLLPLFVGLLLFWPRAHRLVAAAALTPLPALLAAIFLPLDTAVVYSWLLLAAQVKLDATAQIFLLFTAVLWFVAAIFGMAYMANDANRPRFFAFFLVAMAGNFGLIIASDMLGYYLWFAVMSFASYGLVVHTGDKAAHDAGRVYIILVVVGEVILFAALALIYFAAGGVVVGDYSSLALSALGQAPLDDLVASLIFIGFGIKAGVVALHVWLPLAHPAAPIPASAVLSGAMIKAGLLGWLRFLYPLPDGSQWGEWVVALGLITAFYGAVVGVSQVNPKTVLAYSSISQMGFIMVGVGIWLATGAATGAALTAVLLYATHHALAKGALFLGGGFAGSGRAAFLILLLPALALAGLPLTSGAVAKAALKSVTPGLPGNWPLDTLLALAAVGTTLLMARFLWLIWRSEPQKKAVPPLMWGSWLLLVAGVAVVLYLLPMSTTAVAESLKADKLWPAIWPILLGLLAAAAATRYTPRSWDLPLIPPGDLVVPFGWAAGQLQKLLFWLKQFLVRAESFILANVTPGAALDAVGRWLGRAEYRLRTDWSLVGSALLLMALSILLTIWANSP
jgi:hydrogenase-4 component B